MLELDRQGMGKNTRALQDADNLRPQNTRIAMTLIIRMDVMMQNSTAHSTVIYILYYFVKVQPFTRTIYQSRPAVRHSKAQYPTVRYSTVQ